MKKNVHSSFLKNLSYSVAVLCLFSYSANAANWYVDDGVNTGDRFTTSSAPGSDATGDGSNLQPYRTVNKAMSIANPGDNIYVDAGSFPEYINVTKSFNFYGTNYDISPNPNTNFRGAEANIIAQASFGGGVAGAGGPTAFEVRTFGTTVVIKGFKFTGGKPLSDGHYTRLAASDNNIVVSFEKNFIIGTTALPVDNLFCGTLTRWRTVSIIDNSFNNVNKTPGISSAIQLNDAGSHPATINATITDNSIKGTEFAGILLDNIACANVSRNLLRNIPNEAGIQLAGKMGSATVSYNDLASVNTLALAPNIPPAGSSDWAAIRIFGSEFTGAVYIVNNYVANGNQNGFAVRTGEIITNPNIHVNNNRFVNYTGKAIYHGGTDPGGLGGATPVPATLDGECNYLGTTTPTSPTNVLGPVDFIPFRTNSTDDPNVIGYQPSGVCSSVPVIPNSCDPSVSTFAAVTATAAGDRLETEMAADALKIVIAPNPTRGTFRLRVQGSNNAAIKINVIDVLGRVVAVYPAVAQNSTVIFGEKLYKGIYYAQVIQYDKAQIIRLMKID